jgi:hypothetical protein
MRPAAVSDPWAPLPDAGSHRARRVTTVRLQAVVFPQVGGYCSHIGRSAEIKVRVSPEEKAAIEGAARSVGLKLSDYVRGRALGGVSGNRGGPSAASGGDEAVPTGGRAPAPRRASGPRSVVREGAPMTEVPKIAKRWWADE